MKFKRKLPTFQEIKEAHPLSEKLQTLLSRSITNSRSKDFYDLYIITKLKYESIDKDLLFSAFQNTCKYRNTYFSKETAIHQMTKIYYLDGMLIQEKTSLLMI